MPRRQNRKMPPRTGLTKSVYCISLCPSIWGQLMAMYPGHGLSSAVTHAAELASAVARHGVSVPMIPPFSPESVTELNAVRHNYSGISIRIADEIQAEMAAASTQQTDVDTQ